MIVNCQEDHIQICWEAKNQATSIGLEAYKDECPVCERMKALAECNSTITELYIQMAKATDKLTEVRNILTNRSSQKK